MNIMILLANN